ncbi:MAG: hypothetical protein ACOYM9_24175 [Bradymonadia bacterium]|jgi:hypothetical protein
MTEPRRISWYRTLPPLDLAPEGEEEVEARSTPISMKHDDRESLWAAALVELQATAEHRIEQRLDATGLQHAHVVSEHLEEHHDTAHDTFELRGRWTYITYRDPPLQPMTPDDGAQS